MSQKTSKKTRRRTEDEILDTEFKTPDTTKAKEESLKNEMDDENFTKERATPDSSSKGETTNGEHNGSHNQTPSPKRSIQTRSRSRSNTPLIKTPENTKSESSGTKDEIKVVTNETNGVSHETKDEVNGSKEFSDAAEQCVVENGAVETEPISPSHSNSVEMEPLILDKDEEEPIPELQFDENDLDVESEGSPSRCKTRRSQTRNVSTPKTPKIFGDQQEAESKASVPLEAEDKSGNSTPKKVSSSNDSNLGSSESQPDDNADLNDTSDTYSSVSTDNISTRAVAGSDATRNVDFSYQDSGLFEENSYTGSPNQSLGETLRNLSSRRTIRPIVNEDYRRFVLKNNLDVKGDVYADYESVQRISIGIKRKNRSISPVESKRPKKDTPGLLSYLSNPISNFKSTFSKSSTPKLIAYEKKRSGFDEDEDVDKIRLEVGSKDEEEKKWCAIM